MSSLPVRAVVFLLVLTSTVAAQPVHFGRTFPLTNTRYDNVNADAKLVTNGQDPFLVWSYGWGVTRMNPVSESATVIGHSIPGDAVVWTGRHFVVVSQTESRLLDARGEPKGTSSSLALRGSPVSVATNGENVVVLTRQPELLANVLTADGAFVESQNEFLEFASSSKSAIASNGSEYCVLTATSDGVRATILDRNGKTRSRTWIHEAPQQGFSPVVVSDGRLFFAIWSDGTVKGCVIDPNGISGTPFVVAHPEQGETVEVSSAAWTGDRYAVAYARKNNAQVVGAQIVFVEENARVVIGPSLDGTAPFSQGPSLVVAGGRLFASWGTEHGTVVRDVARPDAEPAPAALGAKLQAAPRAISSADATLVLWLERRDQTSAWWMGIRGVDGSWRERELYEGGSPRLATNGREFLVVHDTVAMRFDRNGSLLQPVTTIPFPSAGVAWDGSDYVIVGRENTAGGEVVAARLSASGTLSPSSAIRRGIGAGTLMGLQVASDGRGNTLIVWHEWITPMQPVGNFPETYGMFLNDPARKRIDIDSSTLTIQGRLGVAWDGAQFVVAYADTSSGVFARRVSAAGVVEPQRITLSSDEAYETTIARAGNGVAIAWASRPVSGVCCADNLTLLDRAGAVFSAGTYPRHSLFEPGPFAVTSLPDGRLAYVGSPTAHDVPYYGSDRIVMAIAETGTAPRVPHAPVVSVERDGQNARVTWTAPSQQVNGYRLEYKAGNGQWAELEQWFRSHERSVQVNLSPLAWRFRVRAWSDGGTSAYSNEAVILPPKRRSVR